MDAGWRTEVVRETIEQDGEPAIIISDQGSLYTTDAFTAMVLHADRNIKTAMNGKGRATGNGYIKSKWNTVMYDKINLNLVAMIALSYTSPEEPASNRQACILHESAISILH